MTARGWCRVDLAGGTLDIWPIGVLHRGARTLNVAIDLPVTVAVRHAELYRVEQGGTAIETPSVEGLIEAPETDLIGLILEQLGSPPVAVEIASGSPRGGGLGASSALAVTLIAALDALFDRPPRDPAAASALARDLEARLMGLPTGRQDHYPSFYGGALEIRHRPGGEAVRTIDCDLGALGSCLSVAYTGRSHFSAGSNWQVVRRRLDGERSSVDRFEGISDAAQRAVAALEAGDHAALGAAIELEWSHRRKLADGVSTPEIESLLEAALAAGAWGGKATGAGGGGCVAVLAPPQARDAVRSAIAAAGGRLLETSPVGEGMRLERT